MNGLLVAERIAFWGLRGLFDDHRLIPSERPKTHERDWGTYREEIEEILFAPDPEFRIRSDVGLKIVCAVAIGELSTIARWNTSLIASPSWLETKLGTVQKAHRPYSADGLILAIWEALRSLPGTGKPVQPKEPISVHNAIAALEELMKWCDEHETQGKKRFRTQRAMAEHAGCTEQSIGNWKRSKLLRIIPRNDGLYTDEEQLMSLAERGKNQKRKGKT